MDNKTEDRICSVCGNEIPPSKYDFTPGYGIDNSIPPRKVCYKCCADRDRKYMIEHGNIALYLCKRGDQYGVTNWPGSLAFGCCYPRVGKHNIAGRRYDVWFLGPDGYFWHGTQYGDNTQICHCKRTKNRPADFYIEDAYSKRTARFIALVEETE